MEPKLIIGLLAILLAVLCGGYIVVYFLFPRSRSNLRTLMAQGSGNLGTPSEERARLMKDDSGQAFERLKKETKKKLDTKAVLTLEDRFFRAGMFSDEDKREFYRLRVLAPVVLAPLFAFSCSSVGWEFAIVGLIMGALLGAQAPYSLMDRRVKARDEDIMFYLPLVIEQVVIGVSSSLDIGPCLQRVVSMADERDSHNCVTELLRYTQHYIRSGVSLEDALIEVGKRSGHTELKHSFMSLSQVAKHGGEVTKQLQELADAVGNQREAKIEEKIKTLES